MPSPDSSALSQCPHCGAMAIVEPHGALGLRCAVCGGPRIDLSGAPSVVLGSEAGLQLRIAGKEHTKHVQLSAAGVSLLGMGGLGLLVAALVLLAAAPGLLPTLATLLTCSAPLGAGLWALQRAAAARRLRTESLHAARLSALNDAQAVLGALDAARVSELLRIDADQAELLLAEASVATLLGQAAPPRLRIEGESSPEGPQDPSAEAHPSEAEATGKATEV